MRLNENSTIHGDRVILVPYRPEHVPTYHQWMKSPELLELTASEPLSLDEEEEMQRKWHLDEDTHLPSSSHPCLTPTELAQCRMVGDVNMFLPEGIKEDAECEIMIADADDRRKGYAQEALQLFLSYAITHLPLSPTQLIARIGCANAPSIRLFEKLGFGVVKVVEVWNEVEMRWGCDAAEGGEGEGQRQDTAKEWPWMVPEGRIGVYDAAS